MKSRADGASTAGAAATAWAEKLGGGAYGGHGRPGRQTCWAVWREDLAVFEVLQPRGDSLRSMVRIASAAAVLYTRVPTLRTRFRSSTLRII